jgi:hypothetical protein
MIDAEKENLRLINMKKHTVHTVVKQYNLIVNHPSLVKSEQLPNPEIFAYLVKKEHLEPNGKIKNGFKFGNTILFGEREAEKFKEHEEFTMHILKSVG